MVDAVIDVARTQQIRVLLIASRNQVDARALGGGYVDGWSTEDLSAYVRERDPDGRVVLCRDHGGPFQADADGGLDEATALARAVVSLETDLDCGFEILHIDTSRVPKPERRARVFADLYERCLAHAERIGVAFRTEYGGEDQSTEIAGPARVDGELSALAETLRARSLPMPAFVVVQTGTKVVEDRNEGVLAARPSACGPRVASLARTCRRAGTRLKAHNCDYLRPASRAALRHPGVWRNVAPELGLAETRELLRLLTLFRLKRQRDRFLELAFDSAKWTKWTSQETRPRDESAAVLAGHYVFAAAETSEIRAALDDAVERAWQVPLDRHLREHVKHAIMRSL